MKYSKISVSYFANKLSAYKTEKCKCSYNNQTTLVLSIMKIKSFRIYLLSTLELNIYRQNIENLYFYNCANLNKILSKNVSKLNRFVNSIYKVLNSIKKIIRTV